MYIYLATTVLLVQLERSTYTGADPGFMEGGFVEYLCAREARRNVSPRPLYKQPRLFNFKALY